MLVAKGRIGFRMDVGVWIRQALSRPKVQPIQLDAEMLVSSTRLPGNFTGDPTDCIILATCLHHGLDLVSKDRQIKAYRHVNVVW